MDCRRVQAQIDNYLLDSLDEAVMGKVTEHLKQCRVCARVAEEFKFVNYYLKESLGQITTPARFPDNFVSRIHDKIQREQQKSKRRSLYNKVLTAAAVILISIASYFLLTTFQGHVIEGVLYVEREGETIVCKDLLPVGQTLKTSENQSAKLKLRDDSIIEMSPDTVLIIKSDSRFNGRLLNLEKGELRCRVAKGSGFSIIMPGAELKTMGTEFVVRMSTNKKEIIISGNQFLSFITSATVKVVVSDGKVLLTLDQGEQEIKMGETMIREIIPPLVLDLRNHIKNLINQLDNPEKAIREDAFKALIKIGYVTRAFLKEMLFHAGSIQQPYINRLLARFSGPDLLWSNNISSTGFALHPPVVTEPRIYFSNGLRLSALDRFNGNVIWQSPEYGFNSAPLLHNDIIYSGTSGGHFLAIESHSGKIIWQQIGLGAVQATPVIFNDTIYIGAGESDTKGGKFYALDVQTGKIKWVWTTPGIIAGARVVVSSGGVVLFGAWDHKLYALDALTGALIWDYLTDGIIVTAPLVDEDNNIVYCGSWDNNLYALSLQTGEKQWSIRSDSAIIESPVKTGQRLCWGTKHKIYVFDLLQRAVLWTYNRERFDMGALGTAGDKLYAGTDGGKLIVLDIATGEKTWEFDTWRSDVPSGQVYYEVAGCPGIFNEAIYIVSRSVGAYVGNRVYALKLK